MLLPDTHTIIWLVASPEKIPAKTLALLSDPSQTVFFSPIVSWEIGIKARLGKLKLKVTINEIVRLCLQQYRFETLPISVDHTLVAEKLPEIHKDPFDRLLIAQAASEKLRLVTDDEIIRKYRVSILW
jgi:PIN domain nuclease of toxin-antitoxin system